MRVHANTYLLHAIVLLGALLTYPVSSFSSSTLVRLHHNQQSDRRVSQKIFVTKSYNSASSSSNQKGFFWDFQGYPCYAEVVQPLSSTNNGPWNSVLSALSTTSNFATSSKPTVILVHGFGCSTVYWRETKRYLSEAGYTIHALDLLGQGRSFKAGRSSSPPIEYSINLWGQMVDEYARRYINSGDVVLVGNSLGSLVTLAAATGDWYDAFPEAGKKPYLPSKVQGLCFYNCGVGLNTRNVLKTVPEGFVRTVLSLLFDLFDTLIFANKPLLTYLVDNQITKDTLRNALTALYACADNPASRVNDELVDSFADPVINDDTEKVVEVISQIYLNDAGKTPMEFHEMYFSGKATSKVETNDDMSSSPFLPLTTNFSMGKRLTRSTRTLPIHLIWGDRDSVTPLTGDVGKFYTQLATSDTTSGDLVDVSMQVIRAGHIPFDERPECNEGLIEWLEQLQQPEKAKYQDKTTIPSSPTWPFGATA
ncbi:alpha/beta fold family hydrolase [Nitzschia inconspicua]|uniref:Alpha/beta fold family hydrolase n=1 Tax=Nitzschia inconspicua TaxID=303405 RepID=A0A9K3L717_9STRA|nr:alpha/beta fold family hydrolase [Nitzschia inconspicua]